MPKIVCITILFKYPSEQLKNQNRINESDHLFNFTFRKAVVGCEYCMVPYSSRAWGGMPYNSRS